MVCFSGMEYKAFLPLTLVRMVMVLSFCRFFHWPVFVTVFLRDGCSRSLAFFGNCSPRLILFPFPLNIGRVRFPLPVPSTTGFLTPLSAVAPVGFVAARTFSPHVFFTSHWLSRNYFFPLTFPSYVAVHGRIVRGGGYQYCFFFSPAPVFF